MHQVGGVAGVPSHPNPRDPAATEETWTARAQQTSRAECVTLEHTAPRGRPTLYHVTPGSTVRLMNWMLHLVTALQVRNYSEFCSIANGY